MSYRGLLYLQRVTYHYIEWFECRIKSNEPMPSGKKERSLKTKYSSLFSNRRDIPEPENSVEGIYPLLKEFKNSREETDPVLRNMDENVLQKLNDNRDRSDQRSREMEGSLGLAYITSYQGDESQNQRDEYK